MIEVFDDFLERDEFERLEKHIVYNASFPWFLNRVLDLAEDDGLNYLGRTTCEDEDNRQFCYLFFRKDSEKLKDVPHMGRELEKVIPLIQYFKYSHNPKYQLLHVKANLNVRTPEHVEHGYHRDHPWEGKTCVYYLNDCNGYTKFKNGQIVHSKKNRAVIFDSAEMHTGSTATDEYGRYVINLNWIKEPQKVHGATF